MYSFSTALEGSLESIEPRVIDALKDEGFGVLTEIDIQATLKDKLGEDMEPYKILGACNPPLAHQALMAEPDIGLLLPCNIVLRTVSTGVVVSFMDPAAVLTLVNRPEVEALAQDVRQRLIRVRLALGGDFSH